MKFGEIDKWEDKQDVSLWQEEDSDGWNAAQYCITLQTKSITTIDLL
jgi:hypothetical protein